MDSLQVVAEELTGAEAELFVTGHSLGAAMATLFLADLLASPATLGFRPSQTLAWHYGSPMIGDASFRCVPFSSPNQRNRLDTDRCPAICEFQPGR